MPEQAPDVELEDDVVEEVEAGLVCCIKKKKRELFVIVVAVTYRCCPAVV